MEWLEFINDHELNSGIYNKPPNGELLFDKVIHDILECLTGYKECSQIANSFRDHIPDSALGWLSKWDMYVNTWITNLNSLHKESREYPSVSAEWATLIAKVGTTLNRVPEMRKDVDDISLPDEEKAQLIIQTAIRLITKLNVICDDIQAKEYKRLWLTQQYSNLLG